MPGTHADANSTKFNIVFLHHNKRICGDFWHLYFWEWPDVLKLTLIRSSGNCILYESRYLL